MSFYSTPHYPLVLANMPSGTPTRTRPPRPSPSSRRLARRTRSSRTPTSARSTTRSARRAWTSPSSRWSTRTRRRSSPSSLEVVRIRINEGEKDGKEVSKLERCLQARSSGLFLSALPQARSLLQVKQTATGRLDGAHPSACTALCARLLHICVLAPAPSCRTKFGSGRYPSLIRTTALDQNLKAEH